ncbi:MAG: hypothetical protein ACRDGE_01185 [Candidatus Limnocylindria bacterium]
MELDLGHIAARLVQPFNTESRFYWPLVIAVFAAFAANIAWYAWPAPKSRDARAADRRGAELWERVHSPAERSLRPWVFWINAGVLIWFLVLLIAKVPAWVFLATLAANVAALAYLYAYWLPPQDLAWQREVRRLKYIPEAERRKRRRR